MGRGLNSVSSLDRVTISHYNREAITRNGAMDVNFTPSIVEAYSNIGVDNLRDWRRRGLLAGVGVRSVSGRWSYTVSDVVTLAITNELIQQGVAIVIALKAASAASSSVIAWLGGYPEVVGAPQRKNRFVVAFMDEGKPQAMLFRDFGNSEVLSLPVSIILDAMHMAEKIRPRVGGLFIGAR